MRLCVCTSFHSSQRTGDFRNETRDTIYVGIIIPGCVFALPFQCGHHPIHRRRLQARTATDAPGWLLVSEGARSNSSDSGVLVPAEGEARQAGEPGDSATSGAGAQHSPPSVLPAPDAVALVSWGFRLRRPNAPRWKHARN